MRSGCTQPFLRARRPRIRRLGTTTSQPTGRRRFIRVLGVSRRISSDCRVPVVLRLTIRTRPVLVRFRAIGERLRAWLARRYRWTVGILAPATATRSQWRPTPQKVRNKRLFVFRYAVRGFTPGRHALRGCLARLCTRQPTRFVISPRNNPTNRFSSRSFGNFPTPFRCGIDWFVLLLSSRWTTPHARRLAARHFRGHSFGHFPTALRSGIDWFVV